MGGGVVWARVFVPERRLNGRTLNLGDWQQGDRHWHRHVTALHTTKKAMKPAAMVSVTTPR